MNIQRSISNQLFGVLCTVPGLIALVVLMIYPILYNVAGSLFTYQYVVRQGFLGLGNYVTVLKTSEFWQAWKVSTIYSFGSAGLTFIVGLVLAQGLNRIVRFKAILRTLIILPWAVPLFLSGLMWKWIFDQNIGLINFFLSGLGLIENNIAFLSTPSLALMSGIVATAYVHIPFVTVLIHAGLQNIPRELYEAAQIDGADTFHKFFRITVSLNKTPMVVSFVIIWMFTFRTPDVFFALTGGGPGNATFHAGLYLMKTIYRYLEFGEGAAIGVLMFLTVTVVVVPMVYFGIIRGGRDQ